MSKRVFDLLFGGFTLISALPLMDTSFDALVLMNSRSF
jgi:hypothetical protein